MEMILVGTDTSASADAAVEAAAELARIAHARLLVLFVAPVLDAQEIYDPQRPAEPDEHLSQVRARLSDLAVSTIVVRGDAAEALCQVAQSEGADLIVVGNRGIHGRRRLLASVPQAVLRRCPCSVLVVDTRAAQ